MVKKPSETDDYIPSEFELKAGIETLLDRGIIEKGGENYRASEKNSLVEKSEWFKLTGFGYRSFIESFAKLVNNLAKKKVEYVKGPSTKEAKTEVLSFMTLYDAKSPKKPRPLSVQEIHQATNVLWYLISDEKFNKGYHAAFYGVTPLLKKPK
jgi:hypothetical protein